MKPAHPRRPARPLLVIGWDGATPELVGPWMADGTLPHLASLARRGAWAPLRSVLPPLSPPAWTSMTTGLNPGRHGIWDFGHRAEGTYRVEPTDARRRHGATLWEIASDCGLRTVVMNVPLSHPAEAPRDGVFVPGLGAPALRGATWPADLADELLARFPDYRIDLHSFEHADPADFLSSLLRLTEARAAAAEHLLERVRPDLFVCVFTATDRVQHAFWGQAAHPWSPEERRTWRFADAIRSVYAALDAALGRLVARAGPDASVLVVSDHGFGDLDGDLYLNAALEELGLLVVDRGEPPGPIERLRRAVRGEPPEDRAAVFGDIRWERTRAYSRGLFGSIWLNLRGREPLGQVEPGPEEEALLDRITEALLALRAPGAREPLVDAVLRGRELYQGPLADEAPDLVVVPRQYRWMTRAGREIGPPGVLVGPPAVRHTGNHRIDGVLVGAGPGLRPGARPDRLRLLDVTPTALALLGIEVPRGLDGRPMQELLDCGVAWTDELPTREPDRVSPGPTEQAALVEQLRGLGYLAD